MSVGCDVVVLLEEVKLDLRAGKRFYDKRQENLGDYFYRSILADLDEL